MIAKIQNKIEARLGMVTKNYTSDIASLLWISPSGITKPVTKCPLLDSYSSTPQRNAPSIYTVIFSLKSTAKFMLKHMHSSFGAPTRSNILILEVSPVLNQNELFIQFGEVFYFNGGAKIISIDGTFNITEKQVTPKKVNLII